MMNYEKDAIKVDTLVFPSHFFGIKSTIDWWHKQNMLLLLRSLQLVLFEHFKYYGKVEQMKKYPASVFNILANKCILIY